MYVLLFKIYPYRLVISFNSAVLNLKKARGKQTPNPEDAHKVIYHKDIPIILFLQLYCVIPIKRLDMI